MWPIPRLNNEFVSIFFDSNTLVCCWIQRITTASAPLILRAYRRYPLNSFESLHLIPFNPTKIKKYIHSFLSQHKLHNAFITFCLDGITEKYVTLPTSTPHRSDFEMPTASNMQWEYRYLYPDHEGQYIFYTYTVTRSLLLQYELLAIGLQCNLISITTKNIALLNAYKNIFGIAFRRSQLAIDMMRYDNNIELLISINSLRRMISIDMIGDAQDEKLFIAAACGLFYSERE